MMLIEKTWQINFLRTERHFLLPTVKSIVIAQNLYDILFQYVGSVEREEMLKLFLSKLETHIKSKPRAPFSIPLSELEFLEEGIGELRLLNWFELDVAVCEMVTAEEEDNLEAALEVLEGYITFNRVGDTNTLVVYPAGLTRL